MNMLNPMDNSTQARFALEQARTMSLEHRLKSRETRDELKKTAQQFEGIFIKQLLDAMDKTVERSGFMSGGSGEDMFRGLMFDHISQSISTGPGGSGFGLADAIYRQLESRLPVDTDREESGGPSHD
jgi:Rod binding domain-containing protein